MHTCTLALALATQPETDTLVTIEGVVRFRNWPTLRKPEGPLSWIDCPIGDKLRPSKEKKKRAVGQKKPVRERLARARF